MHRTLAAQLPATAPGTRVRVEGWLHRRRTLASVTFLILRDRSGLAQVVVKEPAAVAQVAGLGEFCCASKPLRKEDSPHA